MSGTTSESKTNPVGSSGPALRFACSACVLHGRMATNAKNTAARAMYRKLGYAEIAIVPTVFNGIPGVDLVLLEKHLG